MRQSEMPHTMECYDVFQPNVALLLVLLVLYVSRLLREREDDRSISFRRLSLRLHPERAALEDASEASEARAAAFAVVAEAYEVLADPLKRAVYDQYGEAGLKGGLRGPDGCIEPYVFHGRPLQTYRTFFGTENPYGDLLDHFANPPPIKECPEEEEKKKDDPVIKALPLTLNEIFYGGIKKMKIQRLVLVGDAAEGAGGGEETKPSTVSEEKVLSIPIMPGMPSGAQIVFPEEGDQGPRKIPADIIFVTEDKPHETFKREGSNLRMTVDVFISEALTGTIITVHTIDERILRVPITSVISPGYVKTISGEGLPMMEDPDRHGDLLIDFNIEFPSYLTPISKSHVHQAFKPDEDEEEKEVVVAEVEKRPVDSTRRMHLDGKLYMRADKLSQICRP